MRKAKAVISGSQALAFVLGERWGTTSDLDVYVGMKRFGPLMQYLKQEGYTIRKTYPSRYRTSEFHKVHKLSKAVGRGKPKSKRLVRSIDVIVTHSSNPVQDITKFHTTVVMNWLTAKNVVVAYPQMTFSKRGVINKAVEGPGKPVVDETLEHYRKYKTRGFNISRETGDLQGPCAGACPAIRRSMSDVGCMTIRLVPGAGKALKKDFAWTLDGIDGQLGGCKNPKCPRGVCEYPKRR